MLIIWLFKFLFPKSKCLYMLLTTGYNGDHRSYIEPAVLKIYDVELEGFKLKMLNLNKVQKNQNMKLHVLKAR